MKPLEEHEKDFWNRWDRLRRDKDWVGAGIECPKCQGELEVNTTALLLSYPSQRQIRCSACGYSATMH